MAIPAQAVIAIPAQAVIVIPAQAGIQFELGPRLRGGDNVGPPPARGRQCSGPRLRGGDNIG